MQLFKLAFSFVLIIFLSFNPEVIESKDVKVFQRGKITLVDETQFKFPYEYEFTDDQDETDLQNAYDEKVPYLPKFILHKNGFDQGYTRVPIVTRKGENTWSTPRPTTQRGEEYKTWGTPKILPITKPTPSRGNLAHTTPVPKTTFIAKFSVPPLKAEKPAKKPEVKPTTTPKSSEVSQTITKLKKFFTRKPTTSAETSTTEAPLVPITRQRTSAETTTEAPIVPIKKQFFTRRPTTASTEASKEVTKSKERKPATSSSVETITEDFTTDFTRKSFKKTKTTTVSAEETIASTKKKQFTRKPTTTITSATSEEPSTLTSKKQFTRKPKPTSTEAASTETSTDATTTRRKFTRRPTSTESTTEAPSEAPSTKRKFFTRRPKPSSTKATTESSTEASTTKKMFTRRPTTSTSTESKPTEIVANTQRKFFFTRRPTSTESTTEAPTEAPPSTKWKPTRRPKPTTTTTEEPTTTMLPLKERLRPILTTREPTPTMPRRFRVFTNPSPAEPPTEELNPQQQIEAQRKLKEKLSFSAGFNQEFSSKHAAKKRSIASSFTSSDAASDASPSFHQKALPPKDVPIDLNSKDSKLGNFHFSKFAERFGIRRIIPSYATTPQGSIIVTPVTASPIAVSNGHGGVEQTVKSNAIILQAQKNPFFLPSNVTPNPSLFSSSSSPPPSTPAPQVQNNRWSSSWSSRTSWDANGHKITSSTSTFTAFENPTTPSPVSRHRSFSHTRTEHPSTATSTTRRITSRPTYKPHVIHHGRQRYRGPTYNCRVLTPIEDGRPSPNNDFSCELKYPGFPIDDTCRCRYDVEARDAHGCATGFLYTCKRVAQRN